jgi:4'-phosphopantetheinyl transferase
VFRGSNAEVWCCDLDSFPYEDEIEMLSKEERSRADRFFQRAHRARYLAAHVALRHLIGDMTGKSPGSLTLLSGRFGKPYIADGSICHFNLSHSGGMALIALSSQCEVGVDIELTTDLEMAPELAAQHFCADELSEWSALPAALRMDSFYKVWTRKEACVKATGWGLQLSPSTIRVGLELAEKRLKLPLPDGSVSAVAVQSVPLGNGSFGALACVLG